MAEGKEKEVELRSEEFQEVLGDIPPWILRWGITMLATIIIIILVGSSIFKYPDIISSTMTLTGTTPPAAIVAKVSGKLTELNIKDNQIVKAGDYLAVIENPANTKDILSLKKYLIGIDKGLDTINTLPPKEMNLGSVQGIYSSFYIIISDYIQFKQQDYYLKKIDLMGDRIKRNEVYYTNMLRQKSIIEEQLKLIKLQYARDSTLNKKGVLSNEEFEKSQNQSLQGRLSLENMSSTLENMQIQIAQMHEDLLDTENQYIEKKNTLETQIKTYLTQLLTEIQTWEINNVLIAPVNGKVTFTTYWVANQNITVGDEIFNIIPTDKGEIIGKASLPIARSGKVKIGQKVNIRFENFPDNEFGIVRGIVQNISLVPSKGKDGNNYIVEIKLPEGLLTTYNKELPYLPEMQAQGDIITEDISLLERFFMPIRRVFKENI
ncbi:HlyD family secretion protein [Dysgonomonas termitidis]|uniref:HlyD family secretion protein n=1 Tax=Dysgonomonas termitidis TaxID=1516126 RepID=A0ABV9KXD5_9BACT